MSDPVARELVEALGEYSRVRREGMSREDACRGLDLVLRGLFRVTKFPQTCDTCDDTGWRRRTCTDQMRCGRKVCALNPAHEHEYVEPCTCPRGDRRRPPAPHVEDAIAAAGRTRPRRGSWSRFGA